MWTRISVPKQVSPRYLPRSLVPDWDSARSRSPVARDLLLDWSTRRGQRPSPPVLRCGDLWLEPVEAGAVEHVYVHVNGFRDHPTD
jgi:hypothetical protein